MIDAIVDDPIGGDKCYFSFYKNGTLINRVSLLYDVFVNDKLDFL